MEKLFYFTVSWRKSAFIISELDRLGTYYELELHVPGQNRFVFPNVPVRVYAELRNLFGEHGHAYQSKSD